MPWVETESASFTARHDEADAAAARDLLQDLETFRGELAELFEKTPGDISVIVHPRPYALALAQPWLPLARMFASPASRRYMAGWFSAREIHVLSPDALIERASPGEGSREALMLSPLHEYAHIAIGLNNPALPPPFGLRSFSRYLRWAWLAEGAATQLSGQTPHLRAAVARRLYEGDNPSFPPSARDAPLLGGALMDLLEQAQGIEAVAALASSLDEIGPQRAIERAFGRRFLEVERDWRERLATGGASGRVSRRRGHLHEVGPDDGAA
ncbi:MAG: hypothetical protein QOF37_319 [Thermoleophilaceae bacterium]|jgi:hypothetical protein|nr:hypothetical protein [Thermoleophilaceae bacterium]